MTEPRIAVLDIETSPNLADVWGLWQQNVSLSQLRERGGVIGVGYKWVGDRKVEFLSDFHDGHEEMVKKAHEVMDEADAIVHYNGTTFDMPHLRREFLLAGLTPPSPHKDIDLLVTVKKRFRFVSNKLDNVSRELGLGGKVSHTGHQLWIDCLAGDVKAWALMKRYCQGDVRLTEALYERLRPWIASHVHYGVFSGVDCCQRCGGTDLERRGLARTDLGSYQQYRCRDCGSWSRSGKSIERVDIRGIR